MSARNNPKPPGKSPGKTPTQPFPGTSAGLHFGTSTPRPLVGRIPKQQPTVDPNNEELKKINARLVVQNAALMECLQKITPLPVPVSTGNEDGELPEAEEVGNHEQYLTPEFRDFHWEQWPGIGEDLNTNVATTILRLFEVAVQDFDEEIFDLAIPKNCLVLGVPMMNDIVCKNLDYRAAKKHKEYLIWQRILSKALLQQAHAVNILHELRPDEPAMATEKFDEIQNHLNTSTKSLFGLMRKLLRGRKYLIRGNNQRGESSRDRGTSRREVGNRHESVHDTFKPATKRSRYEDPIE